MNYYYSFVELVQTIFSLPRRKKRRSVFFRYFDRVKDIRKESAGKKSGNENKTEWKKGLEQKENKTIQLSRDNFYTRLAWEASGSAQPVLGLLCANRWYQHCFIWSTRWEFYWNKISESKNAFPMKTARREEEKRQENNER